jgi:hypothetical protein
MVSETGQGCFMNDSFDEEFKKAWEKLGRDWFTHQWFELQRTKWFLGKLRTLRDRNSLPTTIKRR